MKIGYAMVLATCISIFGSMQASANELSILASDATVRAPIPGMKNSVGHVKLTNNGSTDVVIVSADASFAQSIEMHDHKMIDGVMKMTKVNNVVLPAGGTVTFESGGLHLMLFDVEQALNDAKLVDVKFNTENSGSFTLPFKVESIKMKHMHH